MAIKETPFRSLYVRANGIKTHFVVAGDGAPLVLVHGGGPGARSCRGRTKLSR